MKIVLAILAVVFTSASAHAGVESCARAAEHAAYKAWFKPDNSSFGDIQNGATDVVWQRGDVVSYQVSIQHRKADSSTVNYANYSVRVRLVGNGCQVIKVRKF